MGRMTGLPGVSRLNRMTELYRLVRDSGLFDASWYRRQSRGAQLFPNPVAHYALIGWKQRLNPSPRFDTAFYWDSYRDVRQLGANPLVHYLLHGHKEGRLATTTGKAVRAAHIPHDTPLPLFTAPSANMTRLSVVIDDHTPQVMGLGLRPVVGLASAVAARHNWMLRFILRSDHITRSDIADATPKIHNAPHVDVVVRSPGPTADVECVDGELWWATSATSRASLKDFVMPENLWWVVTAHEADRYPAGELRLLASNQLADPQTRTIVFTEALHNEIAPARAGTIISQVPQLIDVSPAQTTPPTIGVIADDRSLENLFSHSLKLVEQALATGALTTDNWQVAVLGSLTRPVTLTGSVVPRLTQPHTPDQWATEVGSCSILVALGAGTEPSYLAQQAAASGVTTVVSDCGKPVGDHLLEELRTAIARPTSPAPSPLPSLGDVAAELDGLWSDSR